MNKVDIVMTSYNGEKYISEQIDSILNSSYQNFHISIYDDGSTDSTLEIITKYHLDNIDKITIYKNKKNKGVTRNFLEGLSNTDSDYIMFCDQDDYWKEDKILITLNEMIKSEQRNPNLPIAVFTDVIVANKDLKEIHPSFFKLSYLNPYKIDLPRLLMENKLIGCSVMVNKRVRDVIKSNSIPRYAKFHDGWVGLIAASMGEIIFLNKGTLLYRQHGGNLVGNIKFKDYFVNRIKDLKAQKESLIILQRQAEEFCVLYKEKLTKENYNIILIFPKLNKY
ncbi:MAG TPA: glycosyltransferase family 2 protein, partial [Clostridiales bacterium]|nr:glycosyltransferase family 2 protein [Clostridiales bacterium]